MSVLEKQLCVLELLSVTFALLACRLAPAFKGTGHFFKGLHGASRQTDTQET